MTTAIAHRSPEGTLPSRRRLTYEEVVDYIARDPDKVKYPNRQAKFLRNSFELSFLDAMNQEALAQQQHKLMTFQVAQQAIREAAVSSGTSAVAEGVVQSLSNPLLLHRRLLLVRQVGVRALAMFGTLRLASWELWAVLLWVLPRWVLKMFSGGDARFLLCLSLVRECQSRGTQTLHWPLYRQATIHRPRPLALAPC